MNESAFPKDYRKEDIEKILGFVLSGKFCQLVCIPGAGKATLLRLLAANQYLQNFHLAGKEKSTRFIYINLLEITSLDQPTIDEFLLHSLDPQIEHSNDSITLAKQLRDSVTKITQGGDKGQNLIFLFDHFDEFQNKLPRSFFQTLRNLKNLARYKFAAVFATRRDLRELIDPEILKEFYDFFIGNTIYMKIYDKISVDFMFSQIEESLGKKLTPSKKRAIIDITSGHAKLTKTIAELLLRENTPLNQEELLVKLIIRATLYELWLFLLAQEQQVLTTIASGKPVQASDTLKNLVQFDLLKQESKSNLIFTIPLFQEFVTNVIPTITPQKISYNRQTREITKGTEIISELLSPQEYRLLKFLIENEGRIVERDEIVSAVWPDTQVMEGVSDEAIDQMVFRLRKKIEDDPNNPKHLITVKGRGLRFLL